MEMTAPEITRELEVLNGLKRVFEKTRNGKTTVSSKDVNAIFKEYNIGVPMNTVVRSNLLRKDEGWQWWWDAFNTKGEPIMPNIQMSKKVIEDTEHYIEKHMSQKKAQPEPKYNNHQEKDSVNSAGSYEHNHNGSAIEEIPLTISGNSPTKTNGSPYSYPGTVSNPKDQKDIIILKITPKFIERTKYYGNKSLLLILGGLLWEVIRIVIQNLK